MFAGRCDDDYWRAGLELITQKCPNPYAQVNHPLPVPAFVCCRITLTVCLQFHLTADHLSGAFPETCEPACKALFEPFYAEYEATCRPLAPCHA